MGQAALCFQTQLGVGLDAISIVYFYEYFFITSGRIMDFKEILDDYNQEFPFLRKYNDRTLYMVVKPFIVGLRLLKSRFDTHEYRVYFEVIPLWQKKFTVSYCMLNPELKTENNSQLFIAYNKHKELLPKVVKLINNRFGNLLKRNIELKDFIELLHYIIMKDKNYQIKNMWIPIFKAMFGIAIYYNNKLYDYGIKTFDRNVVCWKRPEFRVKRNIDIFYDEEKGKIINLPGTGRKLIYTDSKIKIEEIEEIKHLIFKDIENREMFLATIEKNCRSPKVAKLNIAELVGIDDFVETDEFVIPKTFGEKVKLLLTGL